MPSVGRNSQKTGPWQGCHAAVVASSECTGCVLCRAPGPGLPQGLATSPISSYINWEEGVPFLKSLLWRGIHMLEGTLFSESHKGIFPLASVLQAFSPPQPYPIRTGLNFSHAPLFRALATCPLPMPSRNTGPRLAHQMWPFPCCPHRLGVMSTHRGQLATAFFSLWERKRQNLCGSKVEVSRWCYNYSTKVWRNVSDMESIKI